MSEPKKRPGAFKSPKSGFVHGSWISNDERFKQSPRMIVCGKSQTFKMIMGVLDLGILGLFDQNVNMKPTLCQKTLKWVPNGSRMCKSR